MNNLNKIIEHAKDPSCVMLTSPIFGGAWHSSIRDQYQPRYFVDGKTTTWFDFITFFKSIGTNDFLFRIKFSLNSWGSYRYIFQCSSSGSPIYLGIYVDGSGNINTLTKVTNEVSISQTVLSSAYMTTSEHTFVISRVSGVLSISFDANTITNESGQTNVDCNELVNPIFTNASVSFSEIYIEDLDAGTSWSEPHDVLWQENPQPVLPPVAGESIAQRLGLLTKYNCDTGNLDFRLASISQNNWYVKTGLNFAGWSRPLTIIGRMYIAPDDGGSQYNDYDANVYHPLIAQGWPAAGWGAYLVLAVFYTNQNNSNVYRVALTYNNLSGLTFSAIPPADPRGRTVTLALTIDPTIGKISFYENGVLLNSVTHAALIGFTLLEDTSNTNNDPVSYIHQRSASWQNRNDRVYWCMVFDRVLNDAEIKFLST